MDWFFFFFLMNNYEARWRTRFIFFTSKTKNRVQSTKVHVQFRLQSKLEERNCRRKLLRYWNSSDLNFKRSHRGRKRKEHTQIDLSNRVSSPRRHYCLQPQPLKTLKPKKNQQKHEKNNEKERVKKKTYQVFPRGRLGSRILWMRRRRRRRRSWCRGRHAALQITVLSSRFSERRMVSA